ncbi:DNA-directed RNA polymerase subunit H [Halegenticoccus soli]|uniref:DNA-directed RNA polymerase subunit H n=1 Tax=Halegenticoccus soli TaxID=1985678 RepID=UPI000C6D7E4F|nr:DNA-directed RNA polymerase subunit H [Halegenticoccus soli]
MVDVNQHNLVPEHTVLDDPERVEEVLEEYNVNKTNLPKIKKNDPALRETDAEPGDVVEIVRNSRTAERAVVYRLVVE